MWDGKVDGWDQGNHLKLAAQRAGLELPALQQWVTENGALWREQLLANDSALEEHHWGVPTMVFQGEPFFGQDKIELLLWRMEQKGLERLGRLNSRSACISSSTNDQENSDPGGMGGEFLVAAVSVLIPVRIAAKSLKSTLLRGTSAEEQKGALRFSCTLPG